MGDEFFTMWGSGSALTIISSIRDGTTITHDKKKMATASAAAATVNALADGTGVPFAVKMMNAIAAGVLGAAQVVAVASAKPPAPSFETGGFVGGMRGASMGKDDTLVHARTGEMIANAQQQRELWEVMNGGGGGGGLVLNQPVTIVNNASGDVKADASVDDREITLTVNKIVNKSMQDGKYSNAMRKAEGDYNGKRYY